MKQILLILSVLVISCSAKKTQLFEKEQRIAIQTDTIFIEKSLPIADTIFIKINPKTGDAKCDSLCQETIKNILSAQKIQQQTGKNKWGVYYNFPTSELIFHSHISENKNKYHAKNQLLKQVSIKEKIKVEKVPYVPKIVQVLAWIGGVFLALLFIFLFLKFIIKKQLLK